LLTNEVGGLAVTKAKFVDGGAKPGQSGFRNIPDPSCPDLMRASTTFSFRRRSIAVAVFIVLLAVPLLAGCGFEPLYGDHAGRAMEAELAAVKIMPIREHIGQLLQWQLEKDFNPDGGIAPQHYALHIVLAIKRDFLATEPNNVAPRGSISAAADMALTTLDNKTILYRGKIQSIADYNIGTDAYAAEIGKSGAEKRVVEDIGEQIEIRLSAYFHNKSAAQ
jgi:LPS-assembly lipoprotein